MDFIYFTEMDFGTPRWSYCGICRKRERGFWIDGKVDGDIICDYCDRIWKYDENRDVYARRPLLDPENGMYICPCNKEANEDSLWCDDCQAGERNVRIFTDGEEWGQDYEIKNKKARIGGHALNGPLVMLIISEEELFTISNDGVYPRQLTNYRLRVIPVNLL